MRWYMYKTPILYIKIVKSLRIFSEKYQKYITTYVMCTDIVKSLVIKADEFRNL